MEKVKVGFIGVGGIAAVHLANISKNPYADITAVCDIIAENAQKKAEQFGVNWYTSADDLLEKEKLDAVFLCVPPFAHGDLEEKIASRGIHLMIEKPVGLDLETVRRKSKAIHDSGVICGVGYCLRYLDTVRKAKEYLKDKTIAMIRGYYLTSFVPTPWYRDIEKSGGQLVEQATHTVDLMRYLAGDVQKVYADMSLRVLTDIPNMNIHDVTSVNLLFESGAVGHVDCSMTQPDHRSGVEVLGKDFRVHIDGVNLTITEKDSTIEHRSKVDFYEEQDNQFIAALLENNPERLLSSYDDALKTLAVTLAANKSADIGEPVIVASA